MNHERLPSRRFLFLESYCVGPRCDCRRVMLSVMDEGTRAQVATTNHAFESPWPPHEDEPQTFLDPLNPQSALSDDLVAQFQTMVVHDPGYRPAFPAKAPFRRQGPRTGPNDPCPCGIGK